MAEFDIDSDGVLRGVRLLDGESEVTLPDDTAPVIREIGAFAFTKDTPVQRLILNDGCERIRNKAFYFCSTLEYVKVGSGLKTIEEFAVAGCNNVSEIEVDGGNTLFSDVNGMLATKDGKTIVLGVNAETVEFGGSETKIGDRAFSFCDKLEEIEIPSTVKEIGRYAFSDCNSLTTVTIPANVYTEDGKTKCIKIGYGAFFGCGGIEKVVVSEGITTLPGLGLYSMPSLIIVKLPNSLESIGAVIGEETFEDSGRRLFFDVPAGWESSHKAIRDLLDGAFGQLKERIPIGFYMPSRDGFPPWPEFYNTSVRAGSDISAALSGATLAWDVHYPDLPLKGYYYNYNHDTGKYSDKANPTDIAENYRIVDGQMVRVDSISLYADYSMVVVLSDVYETVVTSEPATAGGYGTITLASVKDWDKLRTSGYLIPDEITVEDDEGIEKKYRVTVLGPNLFEGGTIGATMEIPWTVKRINKAAFKGHSELKKVKFPDWEPEEGEDGEPKKSQLSTIDAQAFMDTGLEEIDIPSAVRTVRQGAFANCDGLKKVSTRSLLDWMRISFGDVACNPLYKGADLWVVTEEEEETFTDKLEVLNSENLGTTGEIKPYAFAGCGSLKTVDFGNSAVTKIGREAFTANEALATVSIGHGISEIGRAAFSNTAVAEVSVPNEVQVVGEFMFNGCKKLTKVSVDTTVVSESMFSNCGKLEDVTIGEDVEEIGKSAFSASGPEAKSTWNDEEFKYYLVGGMSVKFDGTSVCRTIGDYAFSYSWVASAAPDGGGWMANPIGEFLSLPASLTWIGSYAFRKCNGLYRFPDVWGVSRADNALAECDHLYPES